MESMLLNGVMYDLRTVGYTRDIDFYVSKAREIGGPVLELCCGTGRITIPIAKQGVSITGLDSAQSMLACAQEKAIVAGVSVDWRLADATSFDLACKFRLIVAPLDALQLFYRPKQVEDFLECVHAHLAEDGVLVFNVLNPNLSELGSKEKVRRQYVKHLDPNTGQLITVELSSDYDDALQVNRLTFYFSTPQSPDFAVEHILHRCFFPEELNLILRSAGFDIAEKLGDFDGRPFSSGSPLQIVTAEPCRARVHAVA